MLQRYFSTSVIVLLALISFSTIEVFAQTNVIAPPGVDEQITIKMLPEKPGPNESVTVTVESFSANVSKAYIAWYINGVIREEGAGVSSFTFTSGKAGTVQTVSVVITTEDRRVINSSFTIAPAKVSLVAEGITYTPPFYKGKALFTPQANLKVVAFPDFVSDTGYRIPAENLVYTWKVDGEVIQAKSGYGKSSFTMEGSLIPRDTYITAEVSAYNSPLAAVHTLQVSPVAPEIVLYEDSLLYGVRREEAFQTGLYLAGKEVKLIAEPYYISAHIPESTDLQYLWTLNGNAVSSLVKPNTIGLENRTGESGVATLGLQIEHLRKLLQASSISLQVEFMGDNE